MITSESTRSVGPPIRMAWDPKGMIRLEYLSLAFILPGASQDRNLPSQARLSLEHNTWHQTTLFP